MNKAEQTRQHILAIALRMATKTSLNDITIGELAKAAKMSKSGLFSHFKSKENLQVSVVNYASDIFIENVIKPCKDIEDPVAKLNALALNWLEWYKYSAHTCIFLMGTIEFHDQPGPIKEALHYQQNKWIAFLESLVSEAIRTGQFSKECHPQEFVFEFYSIFLGSQKYYFLGKEDKQREHFKSSLARLFQQYS